MAGMCILRPNITEPYDQVFQHSKGQK
jgi:hypothetical protein